MCSHGIGRQRRPQQCLHCNHRDVSLSRPKKKKEANKRSKRCSTTLVIRETKIKPTTCHHFTHTAARVWLKRHITTCVGEDTKRWESSYVAGKKVKQHSHVGEEKVREFLNKLNTDATWHTFQQKPRHRCLWKDYMFTARLFTITKW